MSKSFAMVAAILIASGWTSAQNGPAAPGMKSVSATTSDTAAKSNSTAAAKTTTAKRATAKATGTDKNWKVPRTPDGHPSFEGVWSNNAVTPLERPAQWAGKNSLSDAEIEDLKQRLTAIAPSGDALFGDDLILAALNRKPQISSDVTTGNYNQFWLEDRDFDNRTALITDPADGRIPALTPEADRIKKSRPTGRNYKADGPEDRSLSERCVTFGAPRTQPAYDSYFQLTQAHDTVAIMQEGIHETRVIPVGTSPHIPENVRQWMGDPRGHWEGDTLVVDTTNFSPETNLNGATQNLHTIERFTRVSEDYINWEITWIDAATWTKPWTEMIRLKRSDEQLYEYACHEGNYAMADILAGARNLEKTQAQASAKKTQ